MHVCNEIIDVAKKKKKKIRTLQTGKNKITRKEETEVIETKVSSCFKFPRFNYYLLQFIIKLESNQQPLHEAVVG